ncbi:MAG TPA: exodeoxyribonuclease VII large subunit [Candidatus Dormibacteraeota bacterium]|nr:exodeoxyribonuclease VII large subunit [Candidatus Dormibacteraeota bacterium]
MPTDISSLELGVSEFVGLLNQTLDFAYPDVVIIGELANFRVSKNRWVYFDLKDDNASVKFFGTVYNLPGPLEDGMLLKVRGQPRLHNLYGFSVNVINLQPAGEGSIRRAADLLRVKLAGEGLFDESRKRSVIYPPRRIGLITSKQSAAYADFVKVLHARWQGVSIELIDVQVQGEVAPNQIASAIEQFSEQAEPPDVVVIIRGGGSAEDLSSFSTEIVTRAVASSRVPTLVAIGHEVDLSLAELAADRRASTPSNAAELLVPDRTSVLEQLQVLATNLQYYGARHIQQARDDLREQSEVLNLRLTRILQLLQAAISGNRQLLEALNPAAILRRGYAIVRHEGQSVRSSRMLKTGAMIEVQLAAGSFDAAVNSIHSPKGST